MKAILLLSPFTLQPTIAAVTPSPAAGWGKSPLSPEMESKQQFAAAKNYPLIRSLELFVRKIILPFFFFYWDMNTN